MQEFLNQAKHNEDFHTCICSNYPNTYYDWKITCIFYIAIHYLKALAKHRNKEIGRTHFDINRNIQSTGGYNRTMPITKTASNNYFNLYQYSQTARYDGFVDPVTFNKLKEQDYNHALKCFEDFKKYIVSAGVPIIVSIIPTSI